MTREQFKEAKINALIKYRQQAIDDLNTCTGKYKLANAKRRLESTNKRLSDIEQGKFWTQDMEVIYCMIYEKQDDISAVSAN